MDDKLNQKENLHTIDLEKPIPAFKFAVGDLEFLKIEDTGKVYVKGNHVTDDLALYKGFKVWLQASQEYTRLQFENELGRSAE